MNLKEYLGNALELEKNIYTINNIINRLRWQEQGINVVPKKYNPPRGERRNDDKLGSFLFGGIPGIIVGGIVGGILGINLGNILPFLGLGIIGGIIGYALMDGFVDYYPAEPDYEYKLKEYNRLVENDNLRIKNGKRQKQLLNTQISELVERRKEIEQILANLYNLGIVYPKYRNFIAIASFYEYFESGRCNALDGHEGAYNIYENEIRLNLIINRLDDIITHLEDIKNSQFALYNAISEGNKRAIEIAQNTNKLVESTNELAQSTAINMYYNTIAAKNTEVLKYIALYNMYS